MKTDYNLCRCCKNKTNKIFSGILINHHVQYFECDHCGYVQTEEPYWLNEAYTEAINGSDTGILSRNKSNARFVFLILIMLGKLRGTLVDCAGGYGILVRLMRDFGINALWSDRYCQNILARGFEYKNEKADIVTAFEAFEHFVNPAEELDRLLTIAPNIILSTSIIPDPTPKQDDWWYYGKEHGQHVGFFRLRTLEKLAKERGLFFISNGRSHHLITNKSINKLLWLTICFLNDAITKISTIILRPILTSKTWADHLATSKSHQ